MEDVVWHAPGCTQDDFDDGWDDLTESALQTLPPGEEAALQSHAGADSQFQQSLEALLQNNKYISLHSFLSSVNLDVQTF
jgi:hypothetical protein